MDINKLPTYIQNKFRHHMNTLAKITQEPTEQENITLRRTAREINLYLSDFKCEKCKSTNKLTVHHLVYKIQKNYIKEDRYFKQRYYFGNQAILCCSCHNKAHPTSGPKKQAEACIPPSLIEKIKLKCKTGTN